ncbi:MAG: retroviral-like aspartic protease family protein [Agarilytica sp.]
MEHSSEKKIGKGMLYVAWFIVLIGLTAIFGKWEDSQFNPNQNLNSSTPGEIILQQNRKNHYVASGKINGKRVVFLVDTGATDVSVPAGLAKKLGLAPGQRGKAITANGIVEIRATRIDKLELGSITLYDVRASINPGMTGEEILLGMSALKDLELTQRDATLTIKQI